MALHNRISRKELKERIQNDPTPRITISFYCYFKIEEPRVYRDQLYRDKLLYKYNGSNWKLLRYSVANVERLPLKCW